MSPQEASQTGDGRTKIDQLLEFYDDLRPDSPGSIDVNIPSGYARWKLGYGPGSAEEFAEEEAVMNYGNNNERQTQRKDIHTERLEKKKVAIFVPERCEIPGCIKKGEDVRGCSRCGGCAYYCGRDHQVKDWPRHKLDCKFLSKTEFDMQPKPFLSSKELEKYPLDSFSVSRAKSEAVSSGQAKCFICHSKQSEVDITYTKCCNLPVCDNSHEYRANSYSRDFCHRSHMMYTKCSDHFEEGHEGDWRECKRCNKLKDGARPYASTNGFCITPCLEKFIPQGSMITYACGVPSCTNRILPGHSNTSFKNGLTRCEKCSDSHGTRGYTIHLL